MNCIVCGEQLNLIIINAQNNKTVYICKDCLQNVFDNKILCSVCGHNLYSYSDNSSNTINISAKICSHNGFVCASCEQNNGIRIYNNNCVFVTQHNNFHGYSYKPNPCFHRLGNNDNDNMFLGVELEIGGLHDYDTVRTFCNQHGGAMFYFKSDGSIRGAGCEIVTHPATLAYHLSDQSGWEELFDDFNRIGFISGTQTNTGLHIHVNRDILSTSQMKKIDLLVNQWHSLFKCIGRRTLDNYCRYTSKLHSQWGHSDNRYQSVNFTNSHTVEFRFFCGTNKVEELFASLECVKIIVLLSNDISYDDLYENENAVKNKMKQIAKDQNFTYFSKLMVERTGDNTWRI